MGCLYSTSYIKQSIFLPPMVNKEDYTNPIYKIEDGVSYVDIYPSAMLDERKIVIFSHGNATDIVKNTDYLRFMSDSLGLRVICYDYPGYGMTYGEPSESSCLRSLGIICELFKDKELIMIGQSLGTGVTVCGIKRYNLNPIMVILISPYTSLPDVVDMGSMTSIASGLGIPIFNTYESIDYLNEIDCTVKIYHGFNDTLISIDHSIRLVKKVPEIASLNVLHDTGHNDILSKIDLSTLLNFEN